jgi:hypothetical protein
MTDPGGGFDGLSQLVKELPFQSLEFFVQINIYDIDGGATITRMRIFVTAIEMERIVTGVMVAIPIAFGRIEYVVVVVVVWWYVVFSKLFIDQKFAVNLLQTQGLVYQFLGNMFVPSWQI